MYPSEFVALCSRPGACSPNGPGILLTSNMINKKVAHRLVGPVQMVPPPTNRPPVERSLHTSSHLPIMSSRLYFLSSLSWHPWDPGPVWFVSLGPSAYD